MSRFLQVPDWLLRHSKLTAADVLTMAALLEHDRRWPGGAPSLHTLASRVGKDPRNVQRTIDRLAAVGLVQRRASNGCRTGYELTHQTHGDVAVGERPETNGKVAVGVAAHTRGEVAVPTHGDVAAEPTAMLPENPRQGRRHALREERGRKSQTERKSARARTIKWVRFPAEYEPTDADRTLAVELGVNFEAELAKLRDHEFPKPKTDAGATLRNWLRRARDFGGGRGNGSARRGGVAPVSSDAEWAAMEREMQGAAV